MKAAIIEQPEKLVLREVPQLPPINDYQCYCRNIFASACTGTDRKIIHNKLPWGSSYPAVLGHETVGEVTEVGSKVKNFKIGDTVMRPVYGYAGQEVNGFNNEFGGFSEYGIITDYKAMAGDGLSEDNWSPYSKFQMKVPDSWKTRPESVIFITMKETFSWIRQLGPLYGKRVAVIGSGTVGMFYMKFAALMCAAEVVAIDLSSVNRELALTLGADKFVTSGEGEQPEGQFDLVIDAAGIIDHINDFTPLVKCGGTMAIYGVSSGMGANINAFGSGIQFSFHNAAEDDQVVHDTCVALVDKGFIDLKQFHSSIMPFDKIVEAFEMIEKREELKPVFTFL